MIKWSSVNGPSADDLVNMYSNGPAKVSTGIGGGSGGSSAGPNYAAILGAGTGAGMAWSDEDQARYGLNSATASVAVHDTQSAPSKAGANIRELERTGGRSGGGVMGSGTTDSTVGAVLQRLAKMQANELTILQQKLYQAGYYAPSMKPDSIRFGVNDGATTKAFTELLGDAARTAGDKTWAELLDQQVATHAAAAQQASAANAENDKLGYLARVASAENNYRSANSPEARAVAAQLLDQVRATAPVMPDGSTFSGGSDGLPSLVEHFDPSIKVQNLDPTAARDALNAAFADAVGRAPTAGELAAFSSNYAAAAQASPVVTTAVRDESGATTTSTTGGVDAQPIAEAQYIHSPEYANYQAVSKFFPAIEKVLAGKDLTTIR